MFELFIATLIQFSVLFGGAAPQKSSRTVSTTTTIEETPAQNAAAPGGPSIGGTGWDDKN